MGGRMRRGGCAKGILTIGRLSLRIVEGIVGCLKIVSSVGDWSDCLFGVSCAGIRFCTWYLNLSLDLRRCVELWLAESVSRRHKFLLFILFCSFPSRGGFPDVKSRIPLHVSEECVIAYFFLFTSSHLVPLLQN